MTNGKRLNHLISPSNYALSGCFNASSSVRTVLGRAPDEVYPGDWKNSRQCVTVCEASGDQKCSTKTRKRNRQRELVSGFPNSPVRTEPWRTWLCSMLGSDGQPATTFVCFSNGPIVTAKGLKNTQTPRTKNVSTVLSPPPHWQWCPTAMTK